MRTVSIGVKSLSSLGELIVSGNGFRFSFKFYYYVNYLFQNEHFGILLIEPNLVPQYSSCFNIGDHLFASKRVVFVQMVHIGKLTILTPLSLSSIDVGLKHRCVCS